MDTMDINRALRVYLGADPSGGVTPYGGTERIQLAFGVDSAAVLEQIHRFMDSLYEPSEVVGLPSLADISTFVAERARSRRPELEDDVCRAVGNYESYCWK